jgi:hypothetical protein
MTQGESGKKRTEAQTTAAAKIGAGVFNNEMAQQSDRYDALQTRFRLRPIRNAREREQAEQIVAELSGPSGDLGTDDYLGALLILLHAYKSP